MLNHLALWLECLKHYLRMCVFASAPDRLPYSINALQWTILAYFLLGLTLTDQQRNYATIASQILFEVGLLALVTYLCLLWKKLTGRFAQTLTALVGVNLVISAVTLPIFHLMADSGSLEDGPASSTIYLSMIVVFWNLAVISQIFKRAFEINTVMSAMIAFNYFVLYQFTIIWF